MDVDIPPVVLAVFRDEALELARGAASALNDVANNPSGGTQGWDELRRVLHTLKGAAAAAGQAEVERVVHDLETRVHEVESAGADRALDELFVVLEQLERKLRPAAVSAPPLSVAPPEPSAASSVVPPTVSTPPPVATGQEWLRVSPTRIDQLESKVGELVLARLRHDALNARIVALREEHARGLAAQQAVAKALSSVRARLDRGEWEQLRDLSRQATARWVDLETELQSVCRDARKVQSQSSLVSAEVEESIQGLRLMPLRPFFERFAGAARDAARRTHKRVYFRVDADGAEVDRAVLTRLADPVLHLVRNAVVHGLEPPAERIGRGKGEAGTLTLQARAEGTHAEIRIADDGRGVDEAQVRRTARERGVPGADAAELLDLLTHPGFSTQAKADDLAGRGVGLDVCSSTIRSLDGLLELESEPGCGTTFVLRVPITASTSMGLVTMAGGRPFGVMLASVERVTRPNNSDYGELDGRLVVKIGDESVAVAWLADLLGLPRPQAALQRPPVIILEHGRRRLGVIVDEIPGQQALVIRRFGPAFRRMGLFVGGAVQPDHSIVPVLSVAALFERAVNASTSVSMAALKTEIEGPAHRALVVDDSITMRTLLRNILDAAGYEVSVAENGLAALAILDGMERCDVIVTDLQMPQMDGVEFCQAVRARDMAYVPIVMVTSVAAEHERTKALAAGADAYVVKAAFEQGHFLRRVDSLVRGPAEVHS